MPASFSFIVSLSGLFFFFLLCCPPFLPPLCSLFPPPPAPAPGRVCGVPVEGGGAHPAFLNQGWAPGRHQGRARARAGNHHHPGSAGTRDHEEGSSHPQLRVLTILTANPGPVLPWQSASVPSCCVLPSLPPAPLHGFGTISCSVLAGATSPLECPVSPEG